MTEFERIKEMDVVELAIYINKLQNQAIDDYEKGYFPKSIVENMTMLKNEPEKSYNNNNLGVDERIKMGKENVKNPSYSGERTFKERA